MAIKKAKKKGKSDVVIALSGGIGNQLFQFAYGLYLEKVYAFDVRYDCVLGMPRFTGNSVTLFSLNLFDQEKVVSIGNSNARRILRKCYGWILTEALNGRNRPTLKSRMMTAITQVLLKSHFGRKSVHAARDLGFDSRLPIVNNSIYIGYFQTFKFASDPFVFECLMSLRPQSLGSKYYEILEVIRKERPILIHIRLTDYVSEKNFGIPSISYYKEAVHSLLQGTPTSSVWVISDDLSGARSYLDQLSSNPKLYFLDQSDFNDLEVWSLMRNFSGYVLSNSSFAWWAAFLREDRGSKVFAPDPWFQGMRSPNCLLPRDWVRVRSL